MKVTWYWMNEKDDIFTLLCLLYYYLPKNGRCGCTEHHLVIPIFVCVIYRFSFQEPYIYITCLPLHATQDGGMVIKNLQEIPLSNKEFAEKLLEGESKMPLFSKKESHVPLDRGKRSTEGAKKSTSKSGTKNKTTTKKRSTKKKEDKKDDKINFAKSDTVEKTKLELKQNLEEKVDQMSESMKDVKNAGEQNDKYVENTINEKEKDCAKSDILEKTGVEFKQKSEEKVYQMSESSKDVKNAGGQNDKYVEITRNEKEGVSMALADGGTVIKDPKEKPGLNKELVEHKKESDVTVDEGKSPQKKTKKSKTNSKTKKKEKRHKKKE